MVTRAFRSSLAVALAAFSAAGCASTGAVPRPFPLPRGEPPPSAPAAGAPTSTQVPHHPVTDGYAIAGTALSFRGTPYRNGGSDPSGFDCSGFVWYVLSQHGIRVPRTVGEQFHQGVDVGGALEAGDLVFFDTTGSGASHVGMAIGGDEFVHAPSGRGDVRVERISARYWSTRYVGAKRLW